jgi:hypothetical protein
MWTGAQRMCRSGTFLCRPDTEACRPDTEACRPDTEACRPDTEACRPDTEACRPDTEACRSDTEACHPDTEACGPITGEQHVPKGVGRCVRRRHWRYLQKHAACPPQGSSRPSPGVPTHRSGWAFDGPRGMRSPAACIWARVGSSIRLRPFFVTVAVVLIINGNDPTRAIQKQHTQAAIAAIVNLSKQRA